LCQSVPGISGLVTTYQTAVTTFEGHYNDWKLARGQDSVALANQHEAEAALDEEIRGVGLIILKVSRGRRSSATYQNYFPNGYGTTLSLTAEEALPIAAGLLSAMANETNAEILARREPLEAARAQVQTAYTARRIADDARAQAKAVLEEAKFAWRNAHNDFYFAVRSFFPDRRQWVESLFRVNGRRQSTPADPGNASTDSGGASVGAAATGNAGGSAGGNAGAADTGNAGVGANGNAGTAATGNAGGSNGGSIGTAATGNAGGSTGGGVGGSVGEGAGESVEELAAAARSVLAGVAVAPSTVD
jgi:hypothetical protein